jgi:hypothetical protein
MGFYEGIRRQLRNGGSLEVESSDVLSTEEGYRLTRELLQRTRPTALFFGYHSYAQGGVRYLAEMGLSVPEDISVIMVELHPGVGAVLLPQVPHHLPERGLGGFHGGTYPYGPAPGGGKPPAGKEALHLPLPAH